MGAVAFDTEKEASGFFGIRYREIDPEARRPDLALHVIAEGLQPLADLDFELAVEILARHFAHPEMTGLGEGQEELERRDAARFRPLEIDIGAGEVAENLIRDMVEDFKTKGFGFGQRV